MKKAGSRASLYGWMRDVRDASHAEQVRLKKSTPKSVLPTDAAERKKYPIGTIVREYFPDALALVARLSWEGNQQHHPDKPLHWDKSKSSDEIDALVRHMIEGEWEAVAWRALAMCQRECDKGYNPYKHAGNGAP